MIVDVNCFSGSKGTMPRGPQGEKRPADVIGNAVHVMRVLTGEIEDTIPDDGKDPAAKALGKKGGTARARAMPPERRVEIAKKAAEKRCNYGIFQGIFFLIFVRIGHDAALRRKIECPYARSLIQWIRSASSWMILTKSQDIRTLDIDPTILRYFLNLTLVPKRPALMPT
jgi:hypothetical protein